MSLVLVVEVLQISALVWAWVVEVLLPVPVPVVLVEVEVAQQVWKVVILVEEAQLASKVVV